MIDSMSFLLSWQFLLLPLSILVNTLPWPNGIGNLNIHLLLLSLELFMINVYQFPLEILNFFVLFVPMQKPINYHFLIVLLFILVPFNYYVLLFGGPSLIFLDLVLNIMSPLWINLPAILGFFLLNLNRMSLLFFPHFYHILSVCLILNF